MKANELHIQGINRSLAGTGWVAKRSKVNTASILIGHESVCRCALVTVAGNGLGEDTHFVTVHECHAKTLSAVGFKASKSFYEDFTFGTWGNLTRFLKDLSKVAFDTDGVRTIREVCSA
jgi:hypothetical protein